MKRCALGFCLAVLSGSISSQPAGPCGALVGSALERCQADQLSLQQQLTGQQQQLAQLQRQLEQQQGQISEQQQHLQQQQDQLMQQQQQLTKNQEQSRRNEVLAEQLARERVTSRAATREAADDSSREETRSWKAENIWFGSDYARTQFATRYARQLQKEQPHLSGRPFLDAISAKVRETFGTAN